MKVAINVTREYVGGITSTNINFLNYLHGSSDVSFVGIELNQNRSFVSPVAYRHFSPEWFNHRIISMCDYSFGKIMRRAHSLGDVERAFRPIIKEVQNILRTEKPDVIVISGTYFIPWIISIAAKKEHIPIVLWYAGVLACETSHFKPKQRKIFLSMERSITRRARSIIFPSELCRTTVRKKICDTVTTKNGAVIPNPISPLFTQTSHMERAVENQIAFVGRDARVKNLDAFLDLHATLRKMKWRHGATVVTDYNARRKRKIPSSINIIPGMPVEDLRMFYATQGLIVSPSQFETFGNVPIEAACLGIPVLVNASMGCAEVFAKAKLESMVTDFSDISAAAEQAQRLCGQHILPRQINNLRKQVDAKYVAQRIMAVIRQAASQRA